MAAPVTLSGGAFQDSQGNPLALGYLKFQLSQDGTVPGSGNIASQVEIQINLDANGNVVGGQSIWGNDVISPPNTFYRVTGYTAKGQPAWGPNNQQVTGASLNLSTWIPNQLVQLTTQLTPVTLQTNGVLNPNQILLNQKAGNNMTITADAAGGVTFAASGASFGGTAGQGFLFGAGSTQIPMGGSGTPGNGSANQVCVVQVLLSAQITLRSVTIGVNNAAGVASNFCAGIYSADGLTKLVDAGTNAFNTNSATIQTVTLASPVTLNPGVYWFAYGLTTGSPLIALHQPTLVQQNILNNSSTVIGTAANAISGGNLPATLGTITVQSAGATQNLPLVKFNS